ncbi:PadR family transcriptional regulator [Laspinema palackyanum]|uniref:PadR family transcriptional regulator n=1 Tax=Laspinema palackyanum TaxID=3231601 RepID=UPI00345C7A93|nr:PadR family transcriptional regulator [Laspinema sp. D2c]
MLELSALGLLQRHPLHGYRLKQELELFMSSCMSVNYGAIYPLLKRLEERGYIAAIARESGDAGPSRTIYGITPSGCDRWRQKMLEHPQDSWVKSRARFAIKCFFFSDLEPEARLELMEHRLVLCRARYKSFSEKPLPEDSYQVAVWNRHLDVLKSEIKWVQEQIAIEVQQSGHGDRGKAKGGANHLGDR